VSVEDRPGGGALFRVSLPVAPPAPPAHDSFEASLSGVATGGTILVIDDDILVARLVASQLEEAGFTVDVITDTGRALESLLSDRPYDLVYCDLMMRSMTGMDIAAALEEKAPDRLRGMVFMTGGAFVPRAAEFVALNRDRCIEKPFDAATETRKRLSRWRR
jgi:CheY-like chemotaxis protein